MARVDGVLFCDGCGAEVTWSPYIIAPHTGVEPVGTVRRGEFCCQDCADGRPCKCAERMDFDDDRRDTTTGTAGTSGFIQGW